MNVMSSIVLHLHPLVTGLWLQGLICFAKKSEPPLIVTSQKGCPLSSPLVGGLHSVFLSQGLRVHKCGGFDHQPKASLSSGPTSCEYMTTG